MRRSGLFPRFLLSAALLTAFSVPVRAAVAPAAVTDLRVLSIVSTGLGASSMTVTLAWTAPGEEGAADLNNSTFTIKYSTTPILSEADFNNANFTLNIATNNTSPKPAEREHPISTPRPRTIFALKTTDTEKLTSAIFVAATAQAYERSPQARWEPVGVAWGDYDSDGDLDAIVANAGAEDEYLLRNDGGGTLTKVALAGTAET